MKLLFSWDTKIGTFFIGRSSDGRFHPIFDNEGLGSYATVAQAVDDLVSNTTFSVLHPRTSDLVDTSALGLPEDWQEWNRLA